jgi:hypothetical protein
LLAARPVVEMADRTQLESPEDNRIHAERLSEARNGWLAVAIHESRRLERRARRRQLLIARGLRAAPSGTS